MCPHDIGTNLHLTENLPLYNKFIIFNSSIQVRVPFQHSGLCTYTHTYIYYIYIICSFLPSHCLISISRYCCSAFLLFPGMSLPVSRLLTLLRGAVLAYHNIITLFLHVHFVSAMLLLLVFYFSGLSPLTTSMELLDVPIL